MSLMLLVTRATTCGRLHGQMVALRLVPGLHPSVDPSDGQQARITGTAMTRRMSTAKSC
jgi:hypothetical protein